MYHRGMVEEAWDTAWGVYNVTYSRGYWFHAPEACTIEGDCRVSIYGRPLGIWATGHALE